MIITTRRHGRTRRDIRRLVDHLNKQASQTSEVVTIGNVALSHVDDVMSYMQVMRDASRALVSCHHLSISPRKRLTDEQRDDAVRRILVAMGAEDHAYVLWQHSGKMRADANVVDTHYHLVISHIGPDGRALSDRRSFVQMEATARTMEVDFGEPITHSRKTRSVCAELRRMGRDDVAAVLTAPSEPPKSATSSRSRARADRQGLDIAKAQAAVRAAWATCDSVAAFKKVLQNEGFEIVLGTKPSVFLVVSSGLEVGALDRIVRQRRVIVAARMREEEDNVRQAREATLSGRGDLHGGARGTEDFGTTSAIAGPSFRGRERPGWASGRVEGAPKGDPRHPSASEWNSRTSRTRVLERGAVAALKRLNLEELIIAARAMAAGSSSIHNNRGSSERCSMAKGSGFTDKSDFKGKLLAEAAPEGFDVQPFVADLHMIDVPTPSRPTTKIRLRDGGWIEIDPEERIVRSWGAPGRAQILAASLADAGGWQISGLRHTATIQKARKLSVNRAIVGQEANPDLVAWWHERGYVATSAPDGTWVHVGGSMIRDRGDLMEIYGPLSGDVTLAVVTKAKQAWGGRVYLDGYWTQIEKDQVWLEAQRQGVVVENCSPSVAAIDLWRKEQERSCRRSEVLGRVRSAVQDAADLLGGARGNREALDRLADDLRAFVSSYLDDEQRAELAASDVVSVIPELTRFRKLGEAELARGRVASRLPPTPVPEETSKYDESSALRPI